MVFSMPHILVVDNSNDDYQQVEQLLNGSHTVVSARDVHQAITALGDEAPPPCAVLLDSALPEGLNLIQHIKSERSTIPIILVSSEGHELEAIELLKQGARVMSPKVCSKKNLTAPCTMCWSIRRNRTVACGCSAKWWSSNADSFLKMIEP